MPASHNSRRKVSTTATTASKFSQLPKELLFKILEHLDDEDIVQCTEISFLDPVGVAIIFQRHDIQDPSVYCEVEVRLREGYLGPLRGDLLSALLARGRRYPYIKKLHCAVRPSAFYDSLDCATPIPYEDPDEKPIEDRCALLVGRIDEFLCRVDALEDVHLDVRQWRLLPEYFSRSLERLVNRIIFEKGCSRLHFETSLTSFADGHCWAATSPAEVPPPASTLSRAISRLSCGLFSKADSCLSTHSGSYSSAFPSRLTELRMDSLFFHSKTLPWISNILLNSRIVDFTVTTTPTPGADCSFLDHGLPTLLRTTPHLKSLTMLRVTEETFRRAISHFRLFAALKHLTICVNAYHWPSLSRQSEVSAPPPPIPRSLESLSISPELIDRILPSIPTTKTNLKQIQIVYQETATWTSRPPNISAAAASVREFLDRNIPTPVIIKVKLPMESRNIPAFDILPGTPGWRPGLPLVYADSLTRAFKLLRRDFGDHGGKGFAAVNVFHIDCIPLKSDTRASIDSCVNLIAMFSRVEEVVVQGARLPWDAHKPLPSYTPPQDVAQEITRRVYSSCSMLRRLQIGNTVYLRP